MGNKTSQTSKQHQNTTQKSNEVSKKYLIDKNKLINDEEEFKNIMGKEINYYLTVISSSNLRNSVRGVLYNKLFVLQPWSREVTELIIDNDKKKVFIQNDLPKMINEYQLFMLNLSNLYKNEPNKINKLFDSIIIPI